MSTSGLLFCGGPGPRMADVLLPNSVPAGFGTARGGRKAGKPTGGAATASARASRVLCNIQLSRRARLVYDRALDWIALRPADMHCRCRQHILSYYYRACGRAGLLTRASTTSHFMPTRSARRDHISWRMFMYSCATSSSRSAL